MSADGNYLYGTHYYGGYVDKVSVATDTVVDSWDVGSWTCGLAFDSQRRFLYVGQNDPGTGAVGSIEVIDTTTGTHLGGVALNGEPGPCIQVSPGDDYVYAVSRNPASQERLYKILASDMTIAASASIAGVGADVGFSLSPDGTRVYIPFKSEDKIRIFDTKTMAELDDIDISAPGAVWVSPDGSHAIVTSATTSEVTLNIVDLASKSSVQTLTISGLGSIASGYLRSRVFWDWSESKRVVYIPITASEGG
ncbi:MAG: YncE family protein, partial [Planctomycetes bacterium]|nr:YncE family protein [Planctomycetota bacterium]